MRKLELFLNRLPENVSLLIVRSGDTRKTEEVCGHFEFPTENNNQLIEDILESLPTENMKFRVLAMDNGKQIKGITIPERRTATNLTDPIEALTKGFLDMSYQVERILSTANNTIEHQQDTIEYLVDSLVESREEAGDNQLAVALLEMEKNALEEQAGTSAKEKALELGEKVLSQMMTPKITPETIKNLLKTNPELLAEFLKDEELVGQISTIIMNPE